MRIELRLLTEVARASIQIVATISVRHHRKEGGEGVWEVGESGLNYLFPSFPPSLLPSVRKLIWRQRGKFSERCGDDDDDVALRFLALCDGQLVNQEGEEDDGKGKEGGKARVERAHYN